MHGAETRTRALSLRADTLKRCYTRDSQRDSNPQLIPLRDEYNPYATPTDLVVVDLVVVGVENVTAVVLVLVVVNLL